MFEGGKHVSINLRNFFPISVLTSLLYGGLNHVIFLSLLRFSSVVLVVVFFPVGLYFNL